MSRINFSKIQNFFSDHPDAVKIKGPAFRFDLTADRAKLFDIFFEEENIAPSYSKHGKIILGKKGLINGVRSVAISWYHYPDLNIKKEIKFSDNTEKQIALFKKTRAVRFCFVLQKMLFREVIGCDTSVVKMTGLDQKTYYVVKQGFIGSGSFSRVKDALVFTETGVPVDQRLVIRSSREKVPQYAIDLNCDDAAARQEREGKLNAIDGKTVKRHYTLLEKGFGDLVCYLQLCREQTFYNFHPDQIYQVAIAMTLLACRYQQNGLTHGDIKPKNIMLYADSEGEGINKVRFIDTDFTENNPGLIPKDKKGTPIYLPKILGSTHAQQDAFALSRVLLFDEGVVRRKSKIVWIFLKYDPILKLGLGAMLDTSEGLVTPYSVFEILCGILLNKNNLLSYFYDSQKEKKVNLPVALVELILQYEDSQSKWSWLEDGSVKTFIRTRDFEGLAQLLEEMCDEGKIQLLPETEKANFAVTIDLPMPSQARPQPQPTSSNRNTLLAYRETSALLSRNEEQCCKRCAVM